MPQALTNVSQARVIQQRFEASNLRVVAHKKRGQNVPRAISAHKNLRVTSPETLHMGEDDHGETARRVISHVARARTMNREISHR
jgi:prolyl oligopeptidase PreP (S9A serine peptidase family)